MGVAGNGLEQQLKVIYIRRDVSQYDVVSQIISGGNQSLDVNIFGDDLTQLSNISRPNGGNTFHMASMPFPNHGLSSDTSSVYAQMAVRPVSVSAWLPVLV